MKTKKPSKNRNRILKFTFNISEIKKQDLYFAITYSEIGNPETFTNVLHWSEIEQPKNLFIDIKSIVVFENDKVKCELSKTEAEKLVSILDYHNKAIETL